MISQYLAGLPAYVQYFAAGLIYAALFMVVYVQFTSWRELALIRSGNVAAAVAAVGACIGFVLPMARVIEAAVTFYDMAIWSAITLVAQMVALGIARLLMRDMKARIEAGDLATAVVAAGLSICVGLISRSALTP
jgi:putative membrane protein